MVQVLGLKDAIIKEDIEQIKKSIDAEAFHGKSVLVSGGSGFLGSWICDVLSEVGSKIICLDNLSTGVFENVQHLKGTKGFEFEKADVCTYSRNPKVDMIFHLASRPAPEDYQKHPVETALANATGTDKMLDLARKDDARVFYSSSSEVDWDPEVFPTPESDEGKVDPLGPRSCYEERKILYLAETVRRLTSSSSAIRFLPFPKGDHRRRLPDTKRSIKEIDWSPKMDLENGLNRTILWIKTRQSIEQQSRIA